MSEKRERFAVREDEVGPGIQAPLTLSPADRPLRSGPDLGSRLDSLKRLPLHLTHFFEHSVELLGATLREELSRFETEFRRKLTGLLCLVISIAMLTTAGVLWLQSVFGRWEVSLILPALVYGIGAYVLLRQSDAADR